MWGEARRPGSRIGLPGKRNNVVLLPLSTPVALTVLLTIPADPHDAHSVAAAWSAWPAGVVRIGG